jgi:hypothetical protein
LIAVLTVFDCEPLTYKPYWIGTEGMIVMLNKDGLDKSKKSSRLFALPKIGDLRDFIAEGIM